MLAREANTIIGSRCSQVVKEGAVYYLTIGVKDLRNREGKQTAIIIGDTVLIGKNENSVLTSAIPKTFTAIQHPGPKPAIKEKAPPKVKEQPKTTKQIAKNDAFEEEAAPRNFKYEFKEPVKILTRLQKLQAKDPTIANQELEEGKRLTEHQRRLYKEKTNEMRERLRRGEFKLATSLPV